MMFKDEQVARFIRAWLTDFDETLSPETARLEMARLVFFFALIGHIFHGRPKPQDDNPSEGDNMAA